MKKLSCKEVRQIDMVEYLASLGHQPKKIRNQEYWFCSPFREENTPSFKVNKNRNIWFDFGEGKGGNIIDFGIQYFRCSVNELLEKLSQTSLSQTFSFHPLSIAGEKKETIGSKILILDNRPLASPPLLQYLQKRCIPMEIAKQYCREIDFELYGKKYTSIGFQNDKGGFELRNENFKGSSSPKARTFFERESNEITVFEGFFDFLSFQSLHRNNLIEKTNFLVLNSLAFFQQAKDIMDRHQIVNLYLDRNKQGMNCTLQALRWNEKKYKDRSESFRQGQDLNDWLVQSRVRLTSDIITKNMSVQQSKGRRI